MGRRPDVHNVVDGTQADGAQLVLQPFGTLLHLAACQGDGHVARAEVGVFDGDADGQCLVVHLEAVAIGTMQAGLVAILNEPGIEVASHTVVAAGIGPVGSDVHLNQVVALHVEVFCSRCADNSILWKDDDAAVVVANAYLIFCTKHAAALHATQFAALDGDALVAVVEFGSHDSRNHLLTGSHVGSAADNLQGLALSHIDCADMHVVAVWMHFAGQHLSHPEAFQATLDGLHFFHAVNLETRAGQGVCHFLGAQCRIDIFLKPFV